jgi:NADH-quinone oxidoreductase subunit N
MLLAATGMMVLAAARDLMLVFLGVELMSLAVYVLAGSSRRSRRAAESALKYFLLGAFSTGFLLYGMALLFGATGSTRFVDIAQWVTRHPELTPLAIVGLALLIVGFAFKVAAAPFHVWTPDVYDGAPLPVTAFMAAVVKTAAFAAFARTFTESLSGAVAQWHGVLWWLAAVTMIGGNVLALSQRRIVRTLAYSSIAHAGYLLVGVLVNSARGTDALVFYLVSYTLATMGAFGVLLAVRREDHDALTIDDVRGLWQQRPWLAAAFSVCLLALLGMPLVGGMGFFAKWYLLQSALSAAVPQHTLALVLVLSSAIAAAYYLRLIAACYVSRDNAEGQVARVTLRGSSALWTIVTVSVTLLLAFGVYPTPIARLARRAAIVPSTQATPPVALPRALTPANYAR